DQRGADVGVEADQTVRASPGEQLLQYVAHGGYGQRQRPAQVQRAARWQGAGQLLAAPPAVGAAVDVEVEGGYPGRVEVYHGERGRGGRVGHQVEPDLGREQMLP